MPWGALRHHSASQEEGGTLSGGAFFKGFEFVLSDFGEGLRKWTVVAVREWGRFHDG